MKFVRNMLLPALIGLGILAGIGLVGSASVALREAFRVHAALGWATAAALAAGVFLLVGVPVFRVARLPKGLRRPEVTEGPEWDTFVRRYADRLVGNPILRDEYDGHAALATAVKTPGPELEAQVEAALEHLNHRVRGVVARHAAAVFTTTSISQSGRLDTAIVVSAQLRMIREIAETYWQRPSLLELTRLYGNVGASAFLAGEIEDSEILAILGAPVTASITGMIPVSGTDPLVSLLVNSLLDGSTNAFLTLRVGVIAQRHCGLRLTEDRRALARFASVQAAGLLGSVVGRGARRIARVTRRAITDRAVSGPKKAARGVADIGSAVVGGIAGIAGKAGRKAAALGPKSVELGERGLQETAQFWDSIAGAFRPDDESEVVEKAEN